MLCAKCGANLNDDTRFCTQCGNPIISKHIDYTEPPPQQSTQRFQPSYDEPYDSRVYQAVREPAPRSAYTQTRSEDNFIQEGFSHPYQRLGGGLLAFVIIYILGLFRTIYDVQVLAVSYAFADYYPGLTIAMSAVLLGSAFLFISIIMVFTKTKAYRVMFNLSALSYIAGLAAVLIWLEANKYYLYNYLYEYLYELMNIISIVCWIGIVFEVLTMLIWNIYFSKSVRVKTYFATKFNSHANMPIDYSENKRPKPYYYTPGKTYERRK